MVRGSSFLWPSILAQPSEEHEDSLRGTVHFHGSERAVHTLTSNRKLTTSAPVTNGEIENLHRVSIVSQRRMALAEQRTSLLNVLT